MTCVVWIVVLVFCGYATAAFVPDPPLTPRGPEKREDDNVPHTYAGTVLPKPKQLTRTSNGDVVVLANKDLFVLDTHGVQSEMVEDMIRRYRELIFIPYVHKDIPRPLGVKKRTTDHPSLNGIDILITSLDAPLQLGHDESYTLDVVSPRATIIAPTVFGALYALETFSQLVIFDTESNAFTIPETPIHIEDAPRFKWRGVMIDTARHYLPVWKIKEILDALSYSKMNVLHWHIVDSESFPFQSTRFPNLTKGAYAPEAIYTLDDIRDVVKHAQFRGVRVVPEIDTPGHSYSWGIGYPGITAVCRERLLALNAWIGFVPLDPSNELTYRVVDGVLSDIAEAFSDEYVHLGGDEVDMACWAEFPHIHEFMNTHGISSFTELWGWFIERVMINATSKGIKPVYWVDMLSAGVEAPSDAVFQVWSIHTDYRNDMKKVVKAGNQAILSAGYYLDMQNPAGSSGGHYMFIDTWRDMYSQDPTCDLSSELTPSELERILGGEACVWGESVDEVSWDERTWPRAFAVAERLWTRAEDLESYTLCELRMKVHGCHLKIRGVGLSPVREDYCISLAKESPCTTSVINYSTLHQVITTNKSESTTGALVAVIVGMSVTVGVALVSAVWFWRVQRSRPAAFPL
eukprot:TRINITY_DN27147_c0_g1_i1.p1 TRINITY_DN27147_c0_g1~~TRINITY_DN27147_c0_g1_i1.p1  ORF type:complete len:632 (+),score=95.95 TRINITY_DN27147_c0_g1_i1:2-1897(+)